MDIENLLPSIDLKISKGKLTVESEYCSGYVIPNIHTTHAPESIAVHFVDNLSMISSSMRSHVYSNVPGVVDPDSFSSVTDLKFLEVISTMCNEPPRMPFDKAVKSHYVAAFNSPMITFLNARLGHRVLVLGMDSQEADLVRLEKAAAYRRNSPEVVVVDELLEPGHKFMGSYPHLKSIVTFTKLGDLLDSDEGAGFSTIILNHTFTSFLVRSKSDMEELLYRNSFNDCVLCGTFMDPASIVVEKAAGVSPEETMVEYLGLKVKEGLSYHKIRVFDSIYYDPAYNTDDLFSFFKKWGWDLDIYHSSSFVKRLGGIKASVMKNLANIQCLRVAYAQPLKRHNPPVLPQINPRGLPGMDDCSIVVVPQMSFKAFPVNRNKGIPLNGKDIAALGDSYFIGEKLDGVHCQMWLEKDRLCVSSGLGSFTVALPCGFDSRTYLEGEILFKRKYKNNYSLFSGGEDVKKMVKGIVVFDGMAEFHNREDPFMTRWRVIEGILASRSIPWLVHQIWWKSYSLGEMVNAMYDAEGYVIQPWFAPPGRFRNGFGSARYIKNVYTYEVLNLVKGHIEEVELGTKKFVRLRPDRLHPSTIEDIVRMENGVSLGELHLFNECMRYYYSQLPTKIYKGEIGKDFKPFFTGSSEEYLGALCQDVILGKVLTSESLRQFMELSSVPLFEIGKFWAHEERTIGDFLSSLHVSKAPVMSAQDRSMLKSAAFILDRSKYSNPIIDMDNRLTSSSAITLSDVVFRNSSSFVKENLLGPEVILAWQAVVSYGESDSIFVHKIIGDEMNQSECYLFHEVPITSNRVFVSKARLFKDRLIKRELSDVTLFDKDFISPSVVVQGYDVSDLEGRTLEERISNLRKLGSKYSACPVMVRFYIDAGVFNMSSDVFRALEAAIRAAQIQYIGVITIGL